MTGFIMKRKVAGHGGSTAAWDGEPGEADANAASEGRGRTARRYRATTRAGGSGFSSRIRPNGPRNGARDASGLSAAGPALHHGCTDEHVEPTLRHSRSGRPALDGWPAGTPVPGLPLRFRSLGLPNQLRKWVPERVDPGQHRRLGRNALRGSMPHSHSGASRLGHPARGWRRAAADRTDGQSAASGLGGGCDNRRNPFGDNVRPVTALLAGRVNLLALGPRPVSPGWHHIWIGSAFNRQHADFVARDATTRPDVDNSQLDGIAIGIRRLQWR